jgi:GNAT superfamily N-acetyltransferase
MFTTPEPEGCGMVVLQDYDPTDPQGVQAVAKAAWAFGAESLGALAWARFHAEGKLRLVHYCGLGFEAALERYGNQVDHASGKAVLFLDGEVVGLGLWLPCRWDGVWNAQILERGWPGLVDATLAGTIDGTPDTLAGLLVAIRKDMRRRGFSTVVLRAFQAAARRQRFERMIIPALPHSKWRLPEMNINEYAALRKGTELFDPWLRVHERSGGRIISTVPSHCLAYGLDSWNDYFGYSHWESGRFALTPRPDLRIDEPVEVDAEAAIITLQWSAIWVEYPVSE